MHSGQNHSPSGTSVRGGDRHPRWYGLSHYEKVGQPKLQACLAIRTHFFALERIVVLLIFSTNDTIVWGGDIQRPSFEIGTLAVGMSQPVCRVCCCSNAERHCQHERRTVCGNDTYSKVSSPFSGAMRTGLVAFLQQGGTRQQMRIRAYRQTTHFGWSSPNPSSPFAYNMIRLSDPSQLSETTTYATLAKGDTHDLDCIGGGN